MRETQSVFLTNTDNDMNRTRSHWNFSESSDFDLHVASDFLNLPSAFDDSVFVAVFL